MSDVLLVALAAGSGLISNGGGRSDGDDLPEPPDVFNGKPVDRDVQVICGYSLLARDRYILEGAGQGGEYNTDEKVLCEELTKDCNDGVCPIPPCAEYTVQG